MLFGSDPFGLTPYAISGEAPADTHSAFQDLLADQEAPRVYLLKVTPFSVSGDAETTYRFSQNAVIPVYDGVMWEPRLKVAMTATTGIDSSGGILSDSNTSIGAIDVAWGDTQNDALTGCLFDGRDVTLYMGGVDFDFSEFEAIFSGTARDATWDLDEFHIVLADFDEKMGDNIQSTKYAGTGGYPPEGGDDIKDKPKPLCYGECYNVTPVLVDASNLIYQVHDGPIQGIASVYDQMIELTDDGDMADLTTWSPSSPADDGKYKTDETNGLFRLAATPSGIVTADVLGDKTGGTYASILQAVVRRIITNHSTLTDSDLDLGSFSVLAGDAPYTVGVYIDGDQRLSEVIDFLLNSGGAIRYWSRTGELVVKQLDLADSSLAEIAESEVVSIQRVEMDLPIWSRLLGYKHNFTPMSEDDLAGAVTDALKTFALAEWRVSRASNVLFRSNYHPLAQEVRTDTALVSKTDADTESERQLTMFGALPVGSYEHRHRYNVTVKRHQLLHHPGDVVTLTHSRFGLSGGRNMLILGLTENTTAQTTELRLWG